MILDQTILPFTTDDNETCWLDESEPEALAWLTMRADDGLEMSLDLRKLLPWLAKNRPKLFSATGVGAKT